MYNPIFAKSFSQYERKRFGFGALILCLIIVLSLSSTFKPHLHPLSLIGDAVNMQLSINAVQDMLVMDGMSDMSEQTVTSAQSPKMSINDNDTNVIFQPIVGDAVSMQLPINAAEDTHVMDGMSVKPEQTVGSSENLQMSINFNDPNVTSQFQPIAIETKKMDPLCRTLESHADYCQIEGDIRVDANSSAIYLVTPHSTILKSSINSWIIQPYPRKGITHVKNWTVTLKPADDHTLPRCTKSHISPAILFSMSGYSGNHFHDFADIILPLYLTSFRFEKDVHFLASDYKRWWPSKFRGLLHRLSRHELVDIDREKQVHCYSEMIAGLKYYRELIVNPSSGTSMSQFRQFLQETYSLERTTAIKLTKGHVTRPRLMIVSRKRTRILTNEVEVSRVARKMGYEVVLAEADVRTNLTRFAQIVNSCDVLMGIHGAGLTNMVFLPDNAIVIQVIPLGGIDGFARLDFGNPAAGMNIRYMEYKIKTKESSLSQQYPVDHPIIKDPLSFHRKGWAELRSIYLDNQNVTIDVHRFKGTLAKALKLLRN